MPNQRQLALRLGVSQSTVSLALRGHPSISPEMRKRVREMADLLDYRPNAYVNVVMSQIRAGKTLGNEGVIGMLVDAVSLEQWYKIESFRIFHQGVLRRSRELGFHVENFFLRAPGMSLSVVDRILHSRNIQGLILAPPYCGNKSMNLRWEYYAAVGVGFGWEEQELDRVAFDNVQNYITAFHALADAGYKRIGTTMGRRFTQRNYRGLKWFPAYLECQHFIPSKNKIPIFFIDSTIRQKPIFGKEPIVPGPFDKEKTVRLFGEWIKKWRLDAVLSVVGEERAWLCELNYRVPEDIGLASYARPGEADISGIDEAGVIVGATAVEIVTSKLARYEYGLPSHPKITLIEGRWVSGKTHQFIREN